MKRSKAGTPRPDQESAMVAGIRLTHPDRVLYPGQGITKRDLAAYYAAIAPFMLPHVAGRPLSLVRCPAGRHQSCFYQKHRMAGLPAAVGSVAIEESGGTGIYAQVHDAAGLVVLVQFGVLEFHTWGARADDLERPDRVVFDLDPGPEVPWSRVREAARELRALLETVELEAWLKTTGGKGLHLVVPLARPGSWAETAEFARIVAETMGRRHPGRYISIAAKAARTRRVFVDWLRNTRGATSVAPWSTRARAGAPVSAPISWDELGKVRAGDQFRIDNVRERARRGRDPWAGLDRARQRLSRSALARLAAG